MVPNISSASTRVLLGGETIHDGPVASPDVPKEKPKYVRRIVWRNVIIFSYLHLGALYGIYLIFTHAQLRTTLFTVALGHSAGLGITAGAHRLWSHRSYKAKWPLRLLLVILNTVAFQDSVIDWARNHRVHHKYSGTDADPHNAKRGFFFAHVGWLLCRKHPDVKEKGRGIDLSDLESDPILVFQKKYYIYIVPLVSFILPVIIPVYMWNETWSNAFFVSAILRYTYSLNFTWLVNSAAHLYGSKPYDKYINPAENRVVALLTMGEGWHNYHHVFPWDYKAAELGNYQYNFTTALVDFFAKIGWAYDLKSVSTDMVKKRVERTGDGTHEVWGWGDKDQTQDDKDCAVIFHAKNQ